MAQVKTIPLFGKSPAVNGSDDGEIDRKKRLAEMLMQTQAAPVWSTGQGMLQAGAILMGGALDAKAERDRKAQEESDFELMRQALAPQTAGLGDAPSPFAASSTETSDPNPPSSEGFTGGGRSGGGSRAMAANERAQRAHARLVEKGYSPHAAAGIVGNFYKESSMNTGAVGDNGTAYGLAQWRGPRFKNLQAFAKQQGKDWRDFDTQVDFADHEMRTGQDRGAAIAYQKLRNARDHAEASDIFMNYFERPSKQAAAQSGPQRAQFAASLVRQGVPPAQATAIAANPQAREAYASGSFAEEAAPDLPDLPAPDLSSQRERMARGQRLMRNKRTFQIGYQLYTQAEAEARQLQQDYEKERRTLQRDDYKIRRQESLTREGWDRQEGREDTRATRQEDLTREGWDQQAKRDEARFKREQGAKTFTLSPGQRIVDVTGKVIAEGPPKTDADIEVGPDGAVRVKTGKLTEGQSKDIGFYDRGASAELELREREDALVDFMSKNAGNIPAIGNYLKSPEYRQAEVPARSFLSAVLRKDTGAAITNQEMEIYGGMYLPQPGDDAETLRLKRKARAVALKSLKKGLGTAEVLAESFPDLFDGKSLEPKPKKAAPGKPDAPKVDEPPPALKLTPQQKELWPYLTDQERKSLIRKYGGA